jgi:hypothetical protein
MGPGVSGKYRGGRWHIIAPRGYIRSAPRSVAVEVHRGSFMASAPQVVVPRRRPTAATYCRIGRQWLCSQATHEVLQAAIGTDRNFPFCPPDSRLTAINFRPAMPSWPAAGPSCTSASPKLSTSRLQTIRGQQGATGHRALRHGRSQPHPKPAGTTEREQSWTVCNPWTRP